MLFPVKYKVLLKLTMDSGVYIQSLNFQVPDFVKYDDFLFSIEKTLSFV